MLFLYIEFINRIYSTLFIYTHWKSYLSLHTVIELFRFQFDIVHRIGRLKICTTLGYIVSLILFELGTRVSLSHRQPYVSMLYESETCVPSSRGFVIQYNQELCISSITRCFTKRLQSRPLQWIGRYTKL